MAAHAKLSPSSVKRWGDKDGCRASIQQSEGKPNRSSIASWNGSAEHMVAADCLTNGFDPQVFLGRAIVFYAEIETPTEEHEAYVEAINVLTVIVNHTVTLDQDAIDRINAYVSYVRDRVAVTGGTLFVEQKLPIDHITGEPDATGTGDTCIFASEEGEIIDYKSGSGRVNAYTVIAQAIIDMFTGEITTPAVVTPNGQLAMYAHGMLRKYDLMGDIKRVRLVIVQPRINHVSEFVMSVADLNSYIDGIAAAALETQMPGAAFNPTSDNCFFCPGRIDCAPRQQLVLSKAIAAFPDLDDAQPRPVTDGELGALFGLLPLIRKWGDDVEQRVLMALDNGQTVLTADGTRLKLVTGRKGNKAWADEVALTALIEEMRLRNVMYVDKLITPTQAEKLTGERKRRNSTEPAAAPAAIGPVKWTRLAALITQPEGKAEIALETDPRPARHSIDAASEPVTDLFT